MSASLDALRSALHDRVTDRVSGPEEVAAVLNQGVDLDFQDGSGDTPLYCAACFRRPEILELLIMRGAKIDHGRQSPLFAATVMNSTECARLLLQHKAQVNARDNYGNTPLHTIIPDFGGSEVARLLLENKADYNLENYSSRAPRMMYGGLKQLIEQHIAKNEIEIESEKEKAKDKDKLKPKC